MEYKAHVIYNDNINYRRTLFSNACDAGKNNKFNFQISDDPYIATIKLGRNATMDAANYSHQPKSLARACLMGFLRTKTELYQLQRWTMEIIS